MYGRMMLIISNSPDSLLSDKLSVDEKSSRDTTSSSENISAIYSQSLSFPKREKTVLRDLLRHNNETRYQSPGTQVRKIFTTLEGQKSPFSYFSRNSFFLLVIYTHKPNKKSKKEFASYTL